MPDSFAHALTARLRQNPLVADCVALARTRAGLTNQVAFVVPTREVAPSERWPEAEQHALETGTACPVLLVDRLPLRDDGTIDEQSLLALPVHDENDVAELARLLASQPGVQQAAVLRMPRQLEEPRLHLAALLADTASSVDSPIETSEPTDDVQRPLSLAHGAPRAAQRDEPATLPQALARAVARGTGSLLYIEDDGTEHTATLAELRSEAQRILGGLRAAGGAPGDFVILWLARPRDVLPTFWACLLGGIVPVVVPVPATFKSTSSELDKLRAVWRLLGHCAVLSSGEGCAALAELGEFAAAQTPLLELSRLRQHTAAVDHHQGKPDDVAFLSLSSGSTGVPKCIQLTHRNILSRGRAASELCAQSKSDVVLNWLPFDHIGSISDWHLRCVDLGCSMVYCSKERVLGNPLAWLRMIERHRVTHSWAPNFAYALINSALARAGEERWNLSSMKSLLTAGEAVSSRTLEELLSALKSHGLPETAARSAFGMAELGSGITYSQPSAERPVKALHVNRASLRSTLREVREGDARAITFSALGPVISGMSMRIVDADGALLPERTIGRLQVTGEALSPGYYNNAEANQAFRDDGWFETGDEGFLDDGELYLTGRSKDCLIINGANYFPIEIEKVVEELPSVAVSFSAAYSVRAPGQQREQAALFFVPGSERELAATLRDVTQRVSQRIGVKLDYIVPLRESDVPKTAIGKIQRKQLAAQFEAGGFAEQVRRADLLLANERTIPSWFAEPVWRKVALRPALERASEPRIVLLADGLGVSQLVCQQLPPDTLLEQSSDPAQLAARFAELARDARPVHLVDLRALDGAPVQPMEAERTTLLAHSERLHTLLEGASALLTSGLLRKLTLVGRGAHQVLADDTTCASRSLLPALLHGARLTSSTLRTSYLDLPLGDEASHAAQLALELALDSDDVEVSYREGARYALRLTAPEQPSAPASPLQHGALYVITGGLGGLGAELARLLLTRFRAQLLLLGKSQLDEARSARLSSLAALGDVSYQAVDVSDAQALRAAVERTEQHLGKRAAGIFHLAGTFRDAHSVQEQAASLWQVLEAKVLGALAIDRLLADRPDTLLVSYSSAAGTFPSEHSAAYAAANRFLDTLAGQQRQAGRRSYALGFSAWTDVGMNAQGVSEGLLRERGLYTISPAEGLGSLLAVLSGTPRNVLVGVRCASPAMRSRLVAPAQALHQLRGYYLQDGEAVCLPAQLTSQDGCQLAIEELASAPLTAEGSLDREQLILRLLGPTTLQVAPENALEEQLLAIWQSVLKTQTMGVTCDFFMAGGHSLLAAELVHAINERFATGFPLSLVFEAKTVREQALLIDSGKHGKGVSIVPLQPLGSEPPLFCICGINIYQQLANELAPNIPVYGVLLPIEGEILAGRDVKLSVPEMARQYVQAIREKQPAGPYRVLGLSFGAALAYEVAQQLRKQGADVALLAMLDFVHPRGRSRSLRQYASAALQRLERDKSALLRKARQLTMRALKRSNVTPSEGRDSSELQLAPAENRMSAYQEAWHEYEPSLRPYPGKVLVFRADDQSMWDGFDVAPDLGWRELVGQLEHHDVPGDHLGILRAPNVQVLAGHLRAALELGVASSALSLRDVGTLRGKLDEIDRSLLDVLKERMEVVAELSSVKREQGLPVRCAEREQQLLDIRLSWARRDDLPDTLVRPLFGLILGASRQLQEKQRLLLSARHETKTIAVIGAHGGMGRRMCALFESLGHRVLEVDVNSDLSAEEAAARADVTMIAVPIGITEQVVRSVGPHVPQHGLLMDITSIKQRPMQAMLESTRASVVGTHPMFGPLVSSLQGQRLVICSGRGEASRRWVEHTFQAAGLTTALATAEEHDRAMAEVQVLSHFQTQVMGLTLARLGTSLEKSLRFSTPPYLMELYMAARHFSQDSALYGPIAMDNPLTGQITQAFVDATSTVRDILLRRDSEGLSSVFSEVRSFLGSFAPHGVEQSKLLVDGLMQHG